VAELDMRIVVCLFSNCRGEGGGGIGWVWVLQQKRNSFVFLFVAKKKNGWHGCQILVVVVVEQDLVSHATAI
jgi:hypothetical protein